MCVYVVSKKALATQNILLFCSFGARTFDVVRARRSMFMMKLEAIMLLRLHATLFISTLSLIKPIQHQKREQRMGERRECVPLSDDVEPIHTMP